MTLNGNIASLLAVAVIVQLSGCATAPRQPTPLRFSAAPPLYCGPTRVAPPAPLSLGPLLNPAAPFAVQLRSDRNPLHIGDILTLRMQSEAVAHVSLFHIASSGRTAVLLGNQRFAGGREMVFPDPADRRALQARAPQGVETWLMIGTRPMLEMPYHKDEVTRAGAILELKLAPEILVQRLHERLAQLPRTDWSSTWLQLPLCDPASLSAPQPESDIRIKE